MNNDTTGRDLSRSLITLALVFVVVLGGLAHDENWRKFSRVLIAASVYLAILSAYARFRRRRAAPSAGLAFTAFALAAASAELASGWLRTGTTSTLTLWLAPLAACLIGGLHWLALRTWRPLRSVIGDRTRVIGDR
ncbi:MAG TPA: hypothetical protein VGV59_02890 [Pyrinomonadaceae bacterium]|nr:hypothetical protein [Pyrinomonadaceae bacterium]